MPAARSSRRRRARRTEPTSEYPRHSLAAGGPAAARSRVRARGRLMLPVRLCPFGLLDSMRSIAALTWIAAFLLVPCVSRAHEGHDHDDSARAALASSTYPRVTAQSELYEVVGILKGDRLSIYLDRAATNEPVTDVKVSVP